MLLRLCVAGLATCLAGLPAQDDDPLTRDVVRGYADSILTSYRECVQSTERLRAAVRRLVGDPTDRNLTAARECWVSARDIYGTTEVFRFQDGPIDNRKDGVETWLNAWPIDESYIDRVEGGPAAGGIIQDLERFPNLNPTALTFANERGGETNVSVGWHAVEFLLWGQDLFADGPGRRDATAFDPLRDRDATRRGEYLTIATGLLVEHLGRLVRAWSEDGPYRTEMLAAPPRATVRRMLQGMVVLSGFEMAGERLAVAYETQDQEEEHSCFSDTTHRDFIANQVGIRRIWFGEGGRVGLRALAMRDHPETSKAVDAAIEAALEAARSIPAPFDQAVLGDDDAPGRRAVWTLIQTLEMQAELLAALGLDFGMTIALRPGG
ncbi:MAG: imelysin family protein [Planctomycetota bacterium]|jgi:putative iron-regulated protein